MVRRKKTESREEVSFVPDEKVVFIPEGKVYDFGYMSQTKGKAIIYEEGERNMQDSYAVDLRLLRKA